MNYLAHGCHFLRSPYYLAGTAVPDWLTVVDRRARLRLRHVEPWAAADDPLVAAVAGGVTQHLRDDARFHESRSFAETCLELTVAVRDALDGETGFRPSFLGHLLTEVLLDAALFVDRPERLAGYYEALGQVEPARIEAAVNRIAARPVEGLALFVAEFLRARILSDYADDAKLMGRLNQVMRRVGLPPLDGSFAAILPALRRRVADRAERLMEGIPVSDAPEVSRSL